LALSVPLRGSCPESGVAQFLVVSQHDTVSTKRILFASAVIPVAVVVSLGVRAFQPPVSLAKLGAVKPGMSESQVREILGSPTRIYSASSGGQWTYERFLTFGYVNVLFDTNGVVEYGHYETF
jgi:hypothetical protein